MNSPKYVKKMRNLAREHHAGQKYGERPYMDHIMDVVKITSEFATRRDYSAEEYWIAVGIAFGHDLLEDTDVDAQYLLDVGIPESVVIGIINVTKFDGESQKEYFERVKSQKYSWLVKQADSTSNLIHSIYINNARWIKKYTNYLRIMAE